MADGTSSIMEFSVDLADQEAPPPLPVGQYPAEVMGAVRKTSQTSGNDYAAVSFKISADQYPADFTEGEPDGTTLTYNRVVLEDSARARYRVRKFCEAIVAPLGRSVDLNDWLGMTATVEVVHETYEGEERAVIKSVVAS